MNRIWNIPTVLFILFAINLVLPLHGQMAIDSSITIDEKFILFDSDQYLIRMDDSVLLQNLTDTIESLPSFNFLIEAHTDSDGSNDYNQILSRRRTEAVKLFLLNAGVDSSKIATSYHGEERPIQSNQTEEGKQSNRRAKVVLRKNLKFFQMTGIVIDNITNSPIDSARIVIRSKTHRDSVRSDQNGKFNILVPTGAVAGIDGSADGYLSQTEMFKATTARLTKPLEIRLNRLIPGKKIEFTKFYFVGSKAILLPKSKPELGNLLDIVRSSPSVCFEIIGHVNFPHKPPVSKNTFEYNLSVARAKVIHDYLLRNEVDSSRMFFSARGNWEMVFPKATNESEMQINRRVEIEVKECEEVTNADNAVLKDRNYNFFQIK